MINRIGERVAEQKISIEVTDAAKDWLAREGFDKVYGARPLRRVIQRQIEDPLSEEILKGTVKPGDTVVVDLQNDMIQITPKKGTLAGSSGQR